MKKEKKGEKIHITAFVCQTYAQSHSRKSERPNKKIGSALSELSLRFFAIIQDTTYLKPALHVWQIWCIVFINEHATKRVNEAIEEMNELIKKASVDEDLDKLLICDGWQPKG